MYDCQSCGACCSHKWSWPVLRRDGSDSINIPSEMIHKKYPLMKTDGNRCVALCGKLGEKVSCSIYQDRPISCRKFEAGSALCKEARKASGFSV